MSKYRDSPPPEQVPAYDAACAQAGRLLAIACAERDALAAAEGPLAVGRAAYYPGHRLGSPEAIAEYYVAEMATRRRAQAA